jgi:hypothetical protein
LHHVPLGGEMTDVVSNMPLVRAFGGSRATISASVA